MKTLLREYRKANRYEMDTAFVACMMLLVATVISLSFRRLDLVFGLYGCAIGFLGRGMISFIAFGKRMRWFQPAVALCLAGAMSAQSAELPGPTQYPGPTPPTQVAYDYAGSVSVMLPDPNNPNNPEKMGVVVVGVCVGGLVIAGVYIGVRILSACMKNYEFYITNNAACGDCPARSPMEFGPSPVPPSQPAPPTVANCTACDGAGPAADQPLPIIVEHSFDQKTWTTISYGTAVGRELYMPATGFWRARALSLSLYKADGVAMVHCPPGVLEHSSDLQTWTEVSRSFTNTDRPAEAGFYRVRLN